MKSKIIAMLGTLLALFPLTLAPALAQTDEAGTTIGQDQEGMRSSPASNTQSAPNSNQWVASSLTLPAGTLIQVRLEGVLSSDRNHTGDGFTGVLDQPVVIQGWVVSRRGQTAVGRVAAAQSAGRIRGISQLALELTEFMLVDGQQIPVQTQLIQTSAETTRERDIQGVGTTTGIGAIIGAAAGGGKGAAIGAAAGAAAGIAGILTTRGRVTELYPETLLTFRLEAPVTVSTQQSQQAFKAVSQADYSNQSQLRNPPRNIRPAENYQPVPPYYRGPYYYEPSYYSYPGWYFGYSFGPRFYYGPGIIGRHGFYGHR
jgi:hypothetical protein